MNSLRKLSRILQTTSLGGILLLLISQTVESAAWQIQIKPAQKDSLSRTTNLDCLTPTAPKPTVVGRDAGVVNQSARVLPQPKLSAKAKAAKLSGEVRVNIVVDILTGTVAWARIESGSAELQDTVKDVVCKAQFYPTNDVNAKINAFLVYRFYEGKAVPFKKTTQERHRK
jgi:hypothetical protein